MPKKAADHPLAPLLRQAGHKATQGRIALLELLQGAKRPLGIAEIIKGLRGKKVDQATAYRVLEAFEKAGLVRQVNLRHGHADYEFAAGDDHHHLVCTSCGRIEDFEGCELEPLTRKALRKSRHFASVDQHALELFGLCKTCALKNP